MVQKIIVIDTSKCTACRSCQTACKQWNGLTQAPAENAGTYENPADLAYNTYTRVLFNEVDRSGEVRWLFGQQRCLHCTDAGCMKVCPVPGAITRDGRGSVVIDQELCTGCKYCVFGCPFDVPRFDRSNTEGFGTDRAFKCTFCFDRQDMGREPACTGTCPTGALSFMERDKLPSIREAALKGGVKVYDGGRLATNVVFLLEDRAPLYGLPTDPAIPVPTLLWRTVMKPLGIAAFLAGLAALMVHYVKVGPRRSGAEDEADPTLPSDEERGEPR